MAITTDGMITAILKTWYRDGVENLMFRNSPVLKKINKTRVEGKEQAFAAMYGRGGAVGANFTAAKANAETTARNVEFKVTPGQLFSVYTMNSKEVQASLSKRGAYMKVAGNKMFAATEGFRKTMAAALYGSGYGEIAKYTVATDLASGVEADITLPTDAVMKIDIGSKLDFKSAVDAAVTASASVEAINGNVVTIKPAALIEDADYVICIGDSLDTAGGPNLPVGLDAWLPVKAGRTGANWTTYIGTKFFDVKRSVASDRLAGQFYKETVSTAKKVSAIEALLMKVRRAGSAADLIIMNDEDWKDVANEIQATNTYFTQTSTKGKRSANVGLDSFSASFSTNYIENIYDDPYCPKGKFYILDSSAVELWSYTNVDKIEDDVAGNEPGKPDAMSTENEGHENTAYGLIIDDYLNVQPGSGSINGPDMDVTLQFFGTFVVTNPSVCGVGLFYAADPSTVIGY